MNTDESLRFIRKLQKKLRQIERLEQSPRQPSQDEEIKIKSKNEIRSKLQEILAVLKTANISLDTDEGNTSIEDPEPHDDGDASIASKNEIPTSHGQSKEEIKMAKIHGNTRSVSPIAEITKPKRLKVNEDGECLPSSKVENATTTDSDSQDLEYKVSDSQVAGGGSGDVIKSTATVNNKQKKKKNCTLMKLRKTWKERKFGVKVLEGHNYTITSLHLLGSWAVSGSKDTSVKLWNLNTAKEIRSMGGHTGWVTCVKLLTSSDSDYIRKYIECNNPEYNIDISVKRSDDECFVLSGSTDCSIRYWLVPTGLCVKSLYNYSPVSTFAFHDEARFLFVCSDAGKLIVYDAITGQSLFEKNIHEDCVKNVTINFDKLTTSSFDGSIKIWEIKHSTDDFENIDGRVERKATCSIILLRVFENETCDFRPVYSHVQYDNFMYSGTEGANLRVFNTSVKDGQPRKLKNHSSSFGFTDAVCTLDDILLSSSYDITTGHGTVNIRTLNKECFEAYLVTLREEHLSRILVISASNSNGNICILTGGEKLVLLKQNLSNDTITPEVHAVLRKEAVDSDLESESDGSEIQRSWFWQKSEANREAGEENETSSDSDSNDDEDRNNSNLNESSSSWSCTLL